MCSCRLNWTDWCALAGFRSACQWPKLVPTALAWWSSNSACFQKLPLPKVMLWNLHGFEICMIDQWKLWWCYIFLDRVSSNKNETNIHYFPYRSLSRIKHVFWFAGCFWKLKKDNWYILKGFSICSNCIWIYLHPNLTGEMATETKKTCGHETNRTAADITTGWYHTTTGCTHSSLQCTWYCTFSSVKQRWRLNCGAIVPNSIFYFTELKASTKNKRSSKKNLIWCGLWAITLFQTVRTHLHQCCLCTARAVKETSVIMMQRTPRLDLPSGNRCHVGRAWQNIFWMWVTTFFVPDAACHVCCDVQVFNRCQSPGSSDIFQSPSGPIPKQLYVFNWYFVIFFCTIPHPVEKNCTNASCIDIGSAIYTTKRSSKTALSKPTMQVPKKHCKFRITIWVMNKLSYNLTRQWTRSMHHNQFMTVASLTLQSTRIQCSAKHTHYNWYSDCPVGYPHWMRTLTSCWDGGTYTQAHLQVLAAGP